MSFGENSRNNTLLPVKGPVNDRRSVDKLALMLKDYSVATIPCGKHQQLKPLLH
jgi:hypothetical protein